MPTEAPPSWDNTTPAAVPQWDDTKADLSGVKPDAYQQSYLDTGLVDPSRMSFGRYAQDHPTETDITIKALAPLADTPEKQAQLGRFVAARKAPELDAPGTFGQLWQTAWSPPKTFTDLVETERGMNEAELDNLKAMRELAKQHGLNPDQAGQLPGKGEQIAQGSLEALTDIALTFTSPAGMATLGIAGLPKAAQRGISLLFAGQMLSHVPDQAEQLLAEIRKPEAKRDYRKIAQLAVGSTAQLGFAGLAGAHAAGVELPGVKQVLAKGWNPINAAADRMAGKAAEWMKNRPVTPEVLPAEPKAEPKAELMGDVVDVELVPKEVTGPAQPRLLEAPKWEETIATDLPTGKENADQPGTTVMATEGTGEPGSRPAGQPVADVPETDFGNIPQPPVLPPVQTPKPSAPPVAASPTPAPTVPQAEPAPVPAAQQPAPAETSKPEPTAPTGVVDLRPAVKELADIIEGGTLDKPKAAEILAKAYGGTMASGKFNAKDLGDAVEMAVNHLILKNMPATVSSAQGALDYIRDLKEMLRRIPTQTTRTAEQDKMQQFSTIPTEAYVAAWVANLKPTDVMLEPSAGVGGLAVFAKAAGAHVIANELSERRADLLAQTGIADQISRHNAEHIHAMLQPGIQNGVVKQPTVVVMNPPFSNAANTSRSNTLVGAKHVEAALRLLPEGGRLVAIVGSGMAEGMATFKPWWKAIKQKYNVRANIQVSGKEYAKYGTTFDNQILVIDKTGPTPDGGTVGGRVEKVEELIPLLERIRNERPTLATDQPTLATDQPTPAEPGGAAPTPGGGERTGEQSDAPIEPGSSGQPGPSGGTGGTGQPSGQGAGGLGPTGQRPPGKRTGRAGKQPDAGVGGGSQPGPSGGADRPDAKSGEQLDVGDLMALAQQQKMANFKPSDVIQFVEKALSEQPYTDEDKALARDVLARWYPDEFTKLKEQAKDEGLTVEQLKDGQRKLNDLGVFSEYAPQKVHIAGAKPHPTPLVESTAMASVNPVDPKYSPSLPKDLIAKGGLSDAQLENVVYAGQAHSKMMAGGQRLGYFIGDGTGVGKGRQIAAIIIDNWNKGRRKAVWVSKSGGLIRDAKRDLGDLGFDTGKVIDFWKNSGRALIGAGEGIAFVPYSSLKSGNPGLTADGALHPPELKNNPATGQKEAKPARIHLLHQWLGKDFDGVIVFDEAHLAGNAIDIKGKRGVKKASEQGIMVLDIQRLFPNARVVYASATGATDITNLSYADRLGIWGDGTPFASKEKFFEQIRAGGLSAMEIVARDLKSMGRYLARTLSFEGVDHRQLVHELSGDQMEIYNAMARGWQYVLRHRDETMAQTNAAKDGKARSAAQSAFYGAQQRFYNQLLTAMQMPSIIRDIKAELAKGNSCVLQLVNTDEAAQSRQIAQKAGEAAEGDNYLEDLDLSPRDILLQYIENSYPTVLYEAYQDENGNTKFRPVRDANGNPVQDPEALRRKQELMDWVALLRAPSSPIGMILDTFGADKVAEITGRSQRVVQKEQEDGTMKTVLEKNRGESTRKVEAQEFQDGKRRILIFSDAGGTGFSYHASRRAKNQQRRIHYLVQAGWRADAAMQGFGRTHRSDQAQAPEYVLPSTNIRGHQRFISTIARRLSELGAITGGERKSAGGEMFDENSNLENSYAEDGVEALFRGAFNGDRVAGMSFDELCAKLGYTKLELDEKTGELKQRNVMVNPADGSLVQDKIPSIQQFLNRILSLEVEEQNGVFDAFIERMTARIEAAKADGSYDPGTQTLKALNIRKVSDESVYRDAESTAETRLVTVEHDHPQKLIEWETLHRGSAIKGFAVNNRSGRVFALKEGPVKTSENGSLIETYYRMWVNGYDLVPRSDISRDKYSVVQKEEAQKLWAEQTGALPKVRTERDTYVVGTFLPIWDRLKIPSPKIWRIKADNGETFLGAHVPAKMVQALRQRLGAGQGERRSPEQVFRGVLENGESVELANGWKLVRKRVAGENRIEILGVQYGEDKTVTSLGGFMERIQWTPRFFLPTDEVAGIEAMRKLLEKAPEAGGTVENGMAGSGGRTGSKANSMGGTVRGGETPLTRAETQKPASELLKDWERFRSAIAPQTTGEPARFAANLLRQLNAEMANEEARADHKLAPFRNSFDQTPVPKDWKYDPMLPLPRNLAFIDAYEGGTAAALGPVEAAAAAEFAKQNAQWLEQIHALGTGVLQNAIENYFPHLWDNPDQAKAIIAASLAKRPLQGSKSFLKQRTHELFLEGLQAGLRPVHDNPVDLWMLKRREVARYILGIKFVQGMKEAGLLRFVHAFAKAPDGWSSVNDRAFQVYGPPTVTIKEAFDAGMREATLDVLKQLGVPMKRLAKIRGRGRWGFESHKMGERGQESITTKFGGADWIIWHELGHVLDNRYADLWPTMSATDQMETELRALADLRFAGEDASDYFKKYVRTREEKMAVILQAYLHAPELMGQVAPTIKVGFQNFLKSHPELEIINTIRPSLKLGEAETEQAVGGLVKLGQWYMPDAAARVVNNYLSPGLNPHLWYRTLRSASNLLNGIQLGLSAFHLGFTSLDAAVSRVAIGIEDAVQGKLASAARTMVSVPASPFTNIRAGARLRAAVLEGITDGDMGRLVRALEAAGGRIGQDHFWQTQFTRRMVRAFYEARRNWFVGAPVDSIATVLNAPFALVEQTLRPIMEYIVPRQKLGVFADMAQRELLKLGDNASPEDVREAMRKAWDSVDNRMGQVVYDNLFYNRTLKDVLLLSFRAYGWQLGKYREGIGAGWDFYRAGRSAIRGERPEFTHRMAYALALPLLVGIIGATITYLMTGKRPEGMDYFMPRIGGEDQHGNPLRANLPSYLKDVMHYSKHPVSSFGHSLNPLGSSIFDLLQNKDFYDVRIRNPDDPLWQQGSDVAQWAGKQLVPFSISGAMKLNDDDAPAWKQVAPFFGITPAPARMTMTPAQELASEIIAAAMPKAPRTKEQYDRSQLVKDIVKQIKAGNREKATDVLAGGLDAGILNENAAVTIMDRLQYTPLQFQVHHMSADAAMRVWRVANPDERTSLADIVAHKIENSKSLTDEQKDAYGVELGAPQGWWLNRQN